jgi:hypothetical protein
MPSHAVDLIFRGPDVYGWSERFWYSGPIDQQTLATNIPNLISARAQVLTSSCKIIRARVNQAQYRNPFIFIANNGQGSPGLETPPTVEQEVALSILIQGNPAGFNRPFLHGIPSRIVNGDSYSPDQAFQDNFAIFANFLIGSGLFNVVGNPAGNLPLRYPMTAITPIAPRGFTFTYTVPIGGHAPAVGDVIRISGTRIPGYSGLKRVVATSTVPNPNLTVGGAAPPIGDNAPAPYFTATTLTDNPINTITPDSITTRKAGRPFGLTRGRRPTLYSLRQ